MALNDVLDVDMFDDEEEEDTQEGKYLTFVIGKEEYGLEIRYVIEIIGIQNITEVPDMPNYIKGVINLRGKVIPVMDVRLRFGALERDYDDRTCIVVINIEEQPMGLIVDTVSEVLDIPKTNIEPAPDLRKGRGNKFIKGMGKVDDKVIMLLDEKKFLFEYEGEIEK